jgi:hypothetical protein
MSIHVLDPDYDRLDQKMLSALKALKSKAGDSGAVVLKEHLDKAKSKKLEVVTPNDLVNLTNAKKLNSNDIRLIEFESKLFVDMLLYNSIYIKNKKPVTSVYKKTAAAELFTRIKTYCLNGIDETYGSILDAKGMYDSLKARLKFLIASAYLIQKEIEENNTVFECVVMSHTKFKYNANDSYEVIQERYKGFEKFIKNKLRKYGISVFRIELSPENSHIDANGDKNELINEVIYTPHAHVIIKKREYEDFKKKRAKEDRKQIDFNFYKRNAAGRKKANAIIADCTAKINRITEAPEITDSMRLEIKSYTKRIKEQKVVISEINARKHPPKCRKDKGFRTKLIVQKNKTQERIQYLIAQLMYMTKFTVMPGNGYRKPKVVKSRVNKALVHMESITKNDITFIKDYVNQVGISNSRCSSIEELDSSFDAIYNTITLEGVKAIKNKIARRFILFFMKNLRQLDKIMDSFNETALKNLLSEYESNRLAYPNGTEGPEVEFTGINDDMINYMAPGIKKIDELEVKEAQNLGLLPKEGEKPLKKRVSKSIKAKFINKVLTRRYKQGLMSSCFTSGVVNYGNKPKITDNGDPLRKFKEDNAMRSRSINKRFGRLRPSVYQKLEIAA